MKPYNPAQEGIDAARMDAQRIGPGLATNLTELSATLVQCTPANGDVLNQVERIIEDYIRRKLSVHMLDSDGDELIVVKEILNNMVGES